MASIYDVPQNELIEKAAEELKKVKDIQPPEWSKFARTGAFKDRPPARKDWWHVRAAAILRKLYKQGPIGVSKLRTLYGGKRNRGMKPERFYRGSGSILRKVLQQLEKAGLAKQEEKGVHKGRSITPKGKSLLDKTATQIQKSLPKKELKKPAAPKPEAKPAEEKKAEPKEEKKEEVKKAEPKEEKKAEPKKEEAKAEAKEEKKNE